MAVVVTIIVALVAVLYPRLTSDWGAVDVVATSFPLSEWVTYTDPEAGYSFEYHPDFVIQAGRNAKERFDHVFINLRFVVNDRPRGDIVLIAVLENPERLPLDRFLKTEHALYYSQLDPAWVETDIHRYAKPLSIAGREALRIERDPVTLSLTGQSKYAVYIPHDDRVVAVWLGPNQPPVADYEPHQMAVGLYNRIVDSFQLFPSRSR